MADKDKVTTLQRKSRIAAYRALRTRERYVVPAGTRTAPAREALRSRQRALMPRNITSLADRALRSWEGSLVPPRTAMWLAKEESKGLPYPLPPYDGQNLLLLFRRARNEWKGLGKHRRLALPAIILVALNTWEQEYQLRQARWDQVEREETVRLANRLYASSMAEPEVKRKRRFWPFNRGGKS
jgi:hypothetical protein